jgi:hypothetical protein
MKNKAFTLVEVMIVVAFGCLLAAMVIPSIVRHSPAPKLNGTIIKKETETHNYRGVYYENYIIVVETNRYHVSQEYFDHIQEGQYVYHE